MILNDKRSLGSLPLQDHRKDVDPELRNVLEAYRVESRDKFNRWRAQGHAGSQSPERTVGDIQNAFHVIQSPAGGRRMGSWSFAMTTKTKAKSLPKKRISHWVAGCGP